MNKIGSPRQGAYDVGRISYLYKCANSVGKVAAGFWVTIFGFCQRFRLQKV